MIGLDPFKIFSEEMDCFTEVFREHERIHYSSDERTKQSFEASAVVVVDLIVNTSSSSAVGLYNFTELFKVSIDAQLEKLPWTEVSRVFHRTGGRWFMSIIYDVLVVKRYKGY
jgi:hypothetical protein